MNSEVVKPQSFDKEDFISNLALSLRALNVELTHTSGVKNNIEQTNNPRECYAVTMYGHTPDYHGPQPAYKFTAYAYPKERELFINVNAGNGDWWDILFPSSNGLTPIEKALKDHGLHYSGHDWRIILE